MDDPEAREIFAYASDKADGQPFCRLMRSAILRRIPSWTSRRPWDFVPYRRGAAENMIVNLLRGNIIRNISDILPEEIHLLVYA